MPRILALDYGLKRTGVAVTDPLQIIATPLETVPTDIIIIKTQFGISGILIVIMIFSI